MIPGFDNQLNSSVFLWAQNRMQSLAQAYITVTTQLYYVPDESLPNGLLGYSAPFAQWVYDSGVSGAAIIQTVSGAGGVLDRSSGLMFDYLNGRVLVPSSMGTNLTITGTYSFAEINTYLPNEDEDYILTQGQGQYYLNPNYNGLANSGAPPDVYHTPAVFVNTLHSDDVAFAFGGIDESTTTFSLSVFAQSNYQLNATLSLFRDARYKYIPVLPLNPQPLDPLNQFGDYNGGTGYNYNAYIAQYGSPGQLAYVSQVKTSKVSDRVKMNREYFVGLIDLELQYVRITT